VLFRSGILTPKFLISKLRHAIVIIFIVAAVITPPDVLSQFFLAMPLLVIYGVSILVSFLSQERAA
jgi:sec-independent protein translocase protein TatC